MGSAWLTNFFVNKGLGQKIITTVRSHQPKQDGKLNQPNSDAKKAGPTNPITDQELSQDEPSIILHHPR